MTGVDTPVLDALFEEVQALRDAKARAEELCQQNTETYEKLRPHWAQGYTSDSDAAQASTAALSQLWGLMGVNNQTSAVQRLRELLAGEGR